MQGHPESPRLWEKHADGILRNIGLTPTIHVPCLYLYSGLINNQRVILMRQVDDFAVACPDEQTAHILLYLIEEHLSIPLKRQGLINMFNGIDVTQTRDLSRLTATHTSTNSVKNTLILGYTTHLSQRSNQYHSRHAPSGSRNSTLQ
jgi:hypothetical protein